MNENAGITILETRNDAQEKQKSLYKLIDQIIEKSPKLSLVIRNAASCLSKIFEQDGTPKGDFRVTDKTKSIVVRALKLPHKDFNTGEIRYGEYPFPGKRRNVEIRVQVTPTFLSDEELQELARHHRLVKKIGNCDVELVPVEMQRTIEFSDLVERYRESIVERRNEIKEIYEMIRQLEILKKSLPQGDRIVEIQPDPGPHY